jgi:hypothetical protein
MLVNSPFLHISIDYILGQFFRISVKKYDQLEPVREVYLIPPYVYRYFFEMMWIQVNNKDN